MTKQQIIAYDKETNKTLDVVRLDYKQNKAWFSDIEEDWTDLDCLVLSIKNYKE